MGIWDSRVELSSQCTGTTCSHADDECSCAATPAFVASGLEEDCPDGCVFTSSSPATLQTFDHYLTEGRHSITVEYVKRRQPTPVEMLFSVGSEHEILCCPYPLEVRSCRFSVR